MKNLGQSAMYICTPIYQKKKYLFLKKESENWLGMEMSHLSHLSETNLSN